MKILAPLAECPTCAELNEPGRKYCSACRARLYPVVYCQVCGHEIRGGLVCAGHGDLVALDAILLERAHAEGRAVA